MIETPSSPSVSMIDIRSSSVSASRTTLSCSSRATQRPAQSVRSSVRTMSKPYQWVGHTQDELVFETQASAGRCRTGAIRGKAGASAREFHLSRDWLLLVYAAISNESRSLSETVIMRCPMAGPTSNTSHDMWVILGPVLCLAAGLMVGGS